MFFGSSRKSSVKARLELQSPKAAVPLKINISELMAELLPDSPSWYDIGSSVTHRALFILILEWPGICADHGRRVGLGRSEAPGR